MRQTPRQITGALVALAVGVSSAMAEDDLLRGVWDGTYICNQGLTALTLIIEPDGDQWSGIFSFRPDKSNKAVASGSFKLAITEVKGRIAFEAGNWLTQPEGYVTVDMHGQMSDDLTMISGNVDFDNCETFEVHRRSVMPVIDGKGK